MQTLGDQWESTMQPVCYLCKMVFPSTLKLERHIQYSVYNGNYAYASAVVPITIAGCPQKES